MIRYSSKKPGGEGVVSTVVRLWWMFINNYHTYRWLLVQSVASRRVFLPRNEKRTGETAVITGGSRGIGAAVVRKLLQCDMHVIIGCRNRKTTNDMVKAIRRKGVTTGTAEAMSLDLGSLNSIREFANKVMNKDVTITALINNAGVKNIPYGLTVEGLEQHFQINYLGHVLLTYMLLSKLHWSARPDKCGRVVNVSSLEHYGAYPDLNDSQMQNFYSSDKAYMDTKLMLTTWSDFLDKKLEKIGAFVRSYSVHPGFVKTELWNHVGWVNRIGIVNNLFFEKRESAAEAIAYTALSPQLEGTGGLFLFNNEPSEPHSLCKDEKFQNNLWRLSCEILDIKNNGLAPTDTESDSENDNFEVDYEETDIYDKNQSQIDLDLLEEFHLKTSSSCGYKYFREGLGYSPPSSYSYDKPTPKLNTPPPPSTKSSFITSWKHSFNFNFKIFKYFSFYEEAQKIKTPPPSKPYYEYFINSLFSHWDLNKSWFFVRCLEGLSIFVLRRLDRFNSQYKLVQTLVRRD